MSLGRVSAIFVQIQRGLFSHCDGGSPVDSLGVLMKISLVNSCPSLILVEVGCRGLLDINRINWDPQSRKIPQI